MSVNPPISWCSQILPEKRKSVCRWLTELYYRSCSPVLFSSEWVLLCKLLFSPPYFSPPHLFMRVCWRANEWVRENLWIVTLSENVTLVTVLKRGILFFVWICGRRTESVILIWECSLNLATAICLEMIRLYYYSLRGIAVNCWTWTHGRVDKATRNFLKCYFNGSNNN